MVDYQAAAGLLLFLLGLVLGSFFNVCIYRIPAARSVVRPSSSCPACGRRLRWWQNIPVLGYLVLRGRCYYCQQPISLRYPLVELLTGLLFLGVYLRFGWQPATVAYLVFVGLLIPIIFIDLDHQIIPDRFSLTGIVLGLLFSIGWLPVTWLQSLLGVLVGGGSLWLLAEGYYRLTGREGMGFGDVKLLAMIGAFLGVKSLLLVILVSSLVGSVVGVSLMLLKGENSQYAVPFGPFLALGALVHLFWGEQLISWYLGLLA